MAVPHNVHLISIGNIILPPRHDNDALLALCKPHNKSCLLGHVEGVGTVDASLLRLAIFAKGGPDLTFISLDHIHTASCQNRLDSIAAKCRRASPVVEPPSACATSNQFSNDVPDWIKHNWSAGCVISSQSLDVVFQSVWCDSSHVYDQGSS